MKAILSIVLALVLILLGSTILKDSNLSTELVGAGIISLLSFGIVETGYTLITNYARLRTYILSKYLILSKKPVRFSMSYQYRIKVNDKYLLVKNSNWDFYQHVGGKYKRLPITQKIIKDLDGRDDLKLPTSGIQKDDFAVYIPAKNVIKFLDWFDTKKDREVSHWREFYEELIDGKANVLSKDNFGYVNYNHAFTLTTPLKKSPNLKCWEILQYDILDLIPTVEQKKELEKLIKLGDTDYIKWADEKLIQNDGHNDRSQAYRIGEHTKWILNEKWSPN